MTDAMAPDSTKKNDALEDPAADPRLLASGEDVLEDEHREVCERDEDAEDGFHEERA